MSNENEIPSESSSKLEELSQKTGVLLEELTAEYLELLNNEHVRSDAQFKSDSDRHAYIRKVVWARAMGRPRVKPYNLIPVGFSHPRMAQSGIEISTLFVLVKEDDGIKLRAVIFRDSVAKDVLDVTLFAQYKDVKLGFREQDGKITMFADNRSKFLSPKVPKKTPQELIALLRKERVVIGDLENHLSRKGSDGWLDKTDWKIVRGIITDKRYVTFKDGRKSGVYTLIDETVDDLGGQYLPGLTAWISPALMPYDKDSEVDILGTVDKRDGAPFMNAFSVVAIYGVTRQPTADDGDEDDGEDII